MALSTLLALALMAASGGAGEAQDDSVASAARDYCGLPDAPVVDATNVASVEELDRLVAEASGGPVIITGADLPAADLRRLVRKLAGGCIVDSSLPRTKWNGTVAPDLRLVRTDLEGADFTSATLTRSRFEGVRLANADFSHANLKRARFVGAYGQLFLGGARFHHTSMEGVVFECGITVDAWCMDAYEASFFGNRFSRSDLTTLGIWDEEMLRNAELGTDTAVHPRAVRYLRYAGVRDMLILRAGLQYDVSEGGTLAEARIAPDEFRILNSATREYSSDRPSFDCAAARTLAENMVCDEYAEELRALDRDLAALYGAARKAGKVRPQSQREWLASRDRCSDEECLESAYRARIDTLFAAMGETYALAPDERRTYREDVLPLPPGMRDQEIYARILPVLVDASAQNITLTGMEDGSVSAEGSALGANAHMCDFSVDSARFDPATGWYAGRGEGGKPVPLFRIWGDRLLLRYSGNMADTPDEAQDFISCGARAGFGELRDLGG